LCKGLSWKWIFALSVIEPKSRPRALWLFSKRRFFGLRPLLHEGSLYRCLDQRVWIVMLQSRYQCHYLGRNVFGF
jgi:hypothetical protein